MKTKIKFLSFFLMFYLGSMVLPQKTAAQLSVNFQVFYDELSPYGSWVENPAYGYVWIPDVDPGFTPYATNGYWAFTDDGWTWVSNYSWGWAPFHYGRWYTDPYYGPMWIPDNEWGPGWVTWRRSNDYYGWAPMGPGISINIAYGNDYNEHYNNYTFVRGSNFGRRDINNYYVNSSNNVTIINNTTVINNTRVNSNRNITYNAGPDRREVEKRGGRKITQVAVRESNKPGERMSKNELQIYRPKVQKNASNGQKMAPSRVANLKDVKTTEQRTKQSPAQKTNQQNKQSPAQKTNQQNKQSPGKVQNNKQQQSQPQRNVQPANQQKSQPQQKVQPNRQQQQKQQQSQPQRNFQQQQKQQQSQPQRYFQQQQQQQQAQPQQQKQQQSQPQRNVQQQQQQQQSQPQRNVQQPQQKKNEDNRK